MFLRNHSVIKNQRTCYTGHIFRASRFGYIYIYTVDCVVLAPRNVQATESFYLLGGQDHATFFLKSRFRQNQLHSKNLLEKRLITMYNM